MYLKQIFNYPQVCHGAKALSTRIQNISEFFNTITGVALCIISIINFYENKKSGYTRLF